MTTANTHAPQQDDAASDDIEDICTFQVLISYYDGEDFNGDWHWGEYTLDLVTISGPNPHR